MLHKANIAEMKTGEGKTLVATLPAYLNALTGKGVHVITVNDYLAERDANWQVSTDQQHCDHQAWEPCQVEMMPSACRLAQVHPLQSGTLDTYALYMSQPECLVLPSSCISGVACLKWTICRGT